MPNEKPLRIEDCVSFLVGKAAQQITRRCRDALMHLGITPVQYAVLNVLWEKDGQSMVEIGSRLVLDSATMTGVTDRLETAGLATRSADPGGDRRVSVLKLTDAGRALAAPAHAALQAVNRDVAQELRGGAPAFWSALRIVGSVQADVHPPLQDDEARPSARRSPRATPVAAARRPAAGRVAPVKGAK